VGALTSTVFRFKMRVWFLKQTNSIDPESSVGANTVVWSREGTIYRITPRRHDGVNDTWMADSGRVLYKQVKADTRLTGIKVNGADSPLALALHAVAALGQAGRVAIVGSGRSSVEEQFLTKKLAAALGGAPVALVSRVGQGDRLLVSADRNPNVRGALVTGLLAALPAPQLTGLAAAIDAGQVTTVISLGEDLTAAGLSAAQLAKVAVVYLGTHAHATSAAAKIILPALTLFEKSGTLVNQQFRLQKFHQAVPGPAGATNDLVLLAGLVAALGGSVPSDLGALWKVLAAEVPALGTMTFANLPETGLLLDATPYAALPFAEGETLHYQPAARPAPATA
jgi:NADH-quinone oxidoreductase subunit G